MFLKGMKMCIRCDTADLAMVTTSCWCGTADLYFFQHLVFYLFMNDMMMNDIYIDEKVFACHVLYSCTCCDISHASIPYPLLSYSCS
jgi:hypothetical protein